MRVADRRHEPSADGQLIHKDRGNLRRSGRDDDGVEGAFLLPAFGAVAVAGDDIELTQFIE